MNLFSRNEQDLFGLRFPDAKTVDERMMVRALQIAERGRGRTSPNPVVGAVIARGEEVIAEGWHEYFGGSHAEINALNALNEDPDGATLYVTLEPCSHSGKTKPCAPRVVESGVARVVISISDPNPLVAGKGIRILEDAGIEVVNGLYREYAARQNESYFKWVMKKRPFVTLKMATSLDGKTATRTGDSKWISSQTSRSDVQLLRAYNDAVMVGIGTVLADNPKLNVREVEGASQPLRVIVDGAARTPLDSNIADISIAPTLIAVSNVAPDSAVSALQDKGVEVVRLDYAGRVHLEALMDYLGSIGIASLILEGGATLAGAAFDAGLIDKYIVYTAPKIIGGLEAPGPIGGLGVGLVSETVQLTVDAIFEINSDIKIVSYTPGNGC